MKQVKAKKHLRFHWQLLKIQIVLDYKQEFFQVISGKVRLHSEDGSYHDITAGNAGVIPPNFCGTFEVLEAVKKYYVIVEH